MGFFSTMSTIDERRCSFAISFVNFTTAITKMNKSDNKVTTTIILAIYIFFFKNPEIQTWNIYMYHANSDFSWFVDNLFFNILVQYHYWHFTEIKSIGNRRTYSFIFYFTHKVIFWFYYKKKSCCNYGKKIVIVPREMTGLLIFCYFLSHFEIFFRHIFLKKNIKCFIRYIYFY